MFSDNRKYFKRKQVRETQGCKSYTRCDTRSDRCRATFWAPWSLITCENFSFLYRACYKSNYGTTCATPVSRRRCITRPCTTRAMPAVPSAMRQICKSHTNRCCTPVPCRILKVELVETFFRPPQIIPALFHPGHPLRKSYFVATNFSEDVGESKRRGETLRKKCLEDSRHISRRIPPGDVLSDISPLWINTCLCFPPPSIHHQTEATNFRYIRTIRYRKRTFCPLSFLNLRTRGRLSWSGKATFHFVNIHICARKYVRIRTCTRKANSGKTDEADA